ncbi:topoisomerase DNA-binding C4 zinc finger domain-containing protein [Thioclava sp. F28-4]|uniref:topoisomerase DNA-binding C4 zinc finger domain-containing protein n=1 Tax=Thioclava sp. F28-4 TaxID=1915315 RepID=UPI001FF04068|nr:topoisomerase DNA-binding C4 zinc finger domain-containing protein [Thioclava sp. F28-4]
MYVAMTRARNTVPMLASEARPSIFVRDLIDGPRHEIEHPHGVSERQHICSQRGRRLIYMPGKDGSGWYRCEHVMLCGNRMPACPQCGAGLLVRDAKTGEVTCPACGAGQPACPNCGEGWLTDRKGRYGVFLGSVRFPDGRGKAKIRAPRESRRDGRLERENTPVFEGAGQAPWCSINDT